MEAFLTMILQNCKNEVKTHMLDIVLQPGKPDSDNNWCRPVCSRVPFPCA